MSPRGKRLKKTLLDWSLFRKMGIVVLLVLGILQFPSPLKVSNEGANVLGISDFFSFFNFSPTITVAPTQEPACGSPGQNCCEGSICSGKLSNGKESSCVFWQKDATNPNSVDFVCALPQILTDISIDATKAGTVDIKLFTNAASTSETPNPYTFYVDCNSTAPSVTAVPTEIPDGFGPSDQSLASQRPYGEMTCSYPSLTIDKTYAIRAWATAVQANKTVLVDPVYRSVTVSDFNSFITINP